MSGFFAQHILRDFLHIVIYTIINQRQLGEMKE